MTGFESRRKFIKTPSGKIIFFQSGAGPAALFVHGLLVNGFLWRHQLAEFASQRCVIAADLLAHGATEIDPSQKVSFDAEANMLGQFLDELGIDQVDLVANDSGVGIALIFAANAPHRLRSLTLTNGDVLTTGHLRNSVDFPTWSPRADSQAPLGKDRPFRGS